MNLMTKQMLLLMVRALYFCMEEQWAQLAKHFDVSPAQQHILFLLSTNNKVLSPSQLSELGCWHLSTVTRLVKPLVDKGYVTVQKDKKRPKCKEVILTETGVALLHEISKQVNVMPEFPLIVSHLSDEELLQFIHLGQKILDAHKGEQFKKVVLQAVMEGMDYEEVL
ncbi:MarR family winged helix-turn-helix transcriptional regulator [Bacillus alkalicellulosilyticus]|uniref:MarR family winged helix-turn-helix transcriptional regulator n=1 Tax=Alkalihalobacterium alkalicellulosilyticum TaxID=1912214 RepID=UPI00099861E7|nr:MarR family transcriptional regulator [Bacillus alkalicellulosilyticus]